MEKNGKKSQLFLFNQLQIVNYIVTVYLLYIATMYPLSIVTTIDSRFQL